jgi:serine/threonine protein kinase/tetratricopeptide (TPR) repeat protein
MIGRTLGRYRITGRLGAGGMGEVFAAEDLELRRTVALKILSPAMADDPARLSRFRREACSLAALNHPGIVIIHSVDQAEGLHFLTMELVEGHSLAVRLAAGPFAVPAFFGVAVPLVDAVAAAHVQGVVHRDLKPANVMIGRDGVVKVLDFGLARAIEPAPHPADPGSETERLLTRELVLGTPDYMAPEQIRGEPAGVAGDIYALGVILYEMITGSRPHAGGSVPELFAAVLRDRPRPAASLAPACPAPLSRLIDRCLARDPGERCPSARVLHDELQEMAARYRTGARDPVQSIAVLPFADLSLEGDQRHLCDGIAEEVIAALTRIEGLAVASRMSSFRYRDPGGDSRGIGHELGVRYLLEGSVRRDGDRLRVNAQLVSAADGYQVWSERYDRDLRDVFAVQDEIAARIVHSFRLTMRGPEDLQPRGRRTTDAVAYEDYLKGRYFVRRWGKRNVEIAMRLFAQAIARAPDFAAAHAGLADACSYLYMYIASSSENLDGADRNSLRALELDDTLAEAHASRGLALSLRRHHAEAEREFAAARALDPHLFEAPYFQARDYVVQGLYDRAIEHYRQAALASPDDYQVPILMAQIHHSLGREDEAREANRHGLELAEKAILSNPEDARACYMGAGAMIRLGQRERGQKWAERALAIDPDDPAILYNVACAHAGLGNQERAIECLARTVRAGASYLEWMENDSDLDPLRAHPLFMSLLAALREPAAEA